MLLRCILLVWGGGILSSLASRPDSMLWYDSLSKPFFTPPGWVFPIAWGILYLLISISLARVASLNHSQQRDSALAFFAIQWLLNILFSPVFFSSRSIFGGLLVTVLLLISVVIVYKKFSTLDRASGLLLLPYIAWCAYATALAASIWYLNC